MGASLENIHILMVSFPGQGHINPLLRLGRCLADFGLLITFCCPESAANIVRRSTTTPLGRGTIQFEFIDDTSGPDQSDLAAYVAYLEKLGRDKLPEMIRKLDESGQPVSCLINNPFIPWVSDVAKTLGIPSAVLWVQSCACFSAYYHYCHKLAPFPTDVEPEMDVKLPSLPLLKHDEIPSFLHPRSPYEFLATTILGQFRNLDKVFCVLMDTFQELEKENIEYMSKIGRPIKTIGPLFKVNPSKPDQIKSDISAWLDSKPPRAVVYVSFGTVVELTQEQVDEITLGLLQSGVPFLLVLRSKGFVLPEGSVEGKIVEWAPQEEVLAHPSTACFVTHCGWNSTMEAVASGVPVVAFPQWGDQVTNAKFLVDVWKVGVRMCRDVGDGKQIKRDDVAACLKEAIAGPRAEEMRENALRLKKAATDSGSSHKNIQNFVDKIAAFRGKI